jgi:TatD DNase family protein
MQPKYIDIHSHVNFKVFDEDRDEVIKRALENDTWVINVGTQKDTSRKTVEMAHQYEEGVYAIVGLHPVHTHVSFHDAQEIDSQDGKGFTSRGENFDYDYYKKLALDPKVVAIGECGLDYYHEGENGKILSEDEKEKQRKAFIEQIKLSQEIGKPLMIHSRDAISETVQILKANNAKKGIAHACVRTVAEAREFMDLDFYFTFAGNITFKPTKNKLAFDEVIKFIPLEKILSETDSPYLAPVPHRGQRNEPVYIREIVKKIAEIKNLPEKEVAEAIVANAKRIFRI